ncbi:hypothetical protein NQ317_005441 [Molorchus minor]|uniref:Chromo shadow domain-containing protein n=1 Tax=Molorchus minor TaxID=1323400 RepID=A0ABQ9JJA9_9CUCU|nr:hypothetical protein NQ317_005441 [Molorchus minor]
MWKNCKEADLVPANQVNVRCPDIVINYYENKKQWYCKETIQQVMSSSQNICFLSPFFKTEAVLPVNLQQTQLNITYSLHYFCNKTGMHPGTPARLPFWIMELPPPRAIRRSLFSSLTDCSIGTDANLLISSSLCKSSSSSLSPDWGISCKLPVWSFILEVDGVSFVAFIQLSFVSIRYDLPDSFSHFGCFLIVSQVSSVFSLLIPIGKLKLSIFTLIVGEMPMEHENS